MEIDIKEFIERLHKNGETGVTLLECTDKCMPYREHQFCLLDILFAGILAARKDIDTFIQENGSSFSQNQLIAINSIKEKVESLEDAVAPDFMDLLQDMTPEKISLWRHTPEEVTYNTDYRDCTDQCEWCWELGMTSGDHSQCTNCHPRKENRNGK